MDTAATTVARPAFRKPWEHGAKAYFEADSFAAALEGFRRKRKAQIFHMANGGEAGEQDCARCGVKLKEAAEGSEFSKATRWSTWHYDPKQKAVVGGFHYECSWSQLFEAIIALRVVARG